MNNIENMQPLLEVKNLIKRFPVKEGVLAKTVGYVHAVEDVSFTVNKGETVSLVGESGCGKTTTARTAMNLIKPTSGEALFNGENIFTLEEGKVRKLRKKMQIIFQDPFSSLNPRMSVKDIIAEGMIIHKEYKRKEIPEKVGELMKTVGLDPAWAQKYPHQFSGGQRQRIGIARALATNPDFIVCDEAVSALDVSIQAQIINLLQKLQEELGLAYLFIAHDLAVVKHISHKVIVMYLGKIMEEAPVDELFSNPLHPYTRALMASIPVPDPKNKIKHAPLKGEIPSPVNPPKGCPFHPRCPHAKEECKTGIIKTKNINGHKVACTLY
jgi:oligopeptide/dipeptide ABC transporter ATP-binding protein